MKTTTFETRAKKAGFNKNSNAYRNAERVMTGEKMVRTCHTSGRGRFTTNIDSHKETLSLLFAIGLKRSDLNEGNDSPKGGKTGQYIELSAKGKNKKIQ